MNPRWPDFVGIGAQKAGTTWVYSMLSEHPQVAFPGGKEIHFWDKKNENGFDWYQERLSAEREFTVGEITPAYAILPEKKIIELNQCCQTCRFFFILRNPLERAWSLAKMNAKLLINVASGISFEGQTGLCMQDLSDEWWLKQFKMQGSLARGFYDECLRNWWSVVGEERLLILEYEQLRADPRGFVSDIAEHCGIDGQWFKRQSDEMFAKKVFASEDYELPQRFREALRPLYADSIQRLSAMTGKNYHHWLA